MSVRGSPTWTVLFLTGQVGHEVIPVQMNFIGRVPNLIALEELLLNVRHTRRREQRWGLVQVRHGLVGDRAGFDLARCAALAPICPIYF